MFKTKLANKTNFGTIKVVNDYFLITLIHVGTLDNLV